MRWPTSLALSLLIAASQVEAISLTVGPEHPASTVAIEPGVLFRMNPKIVSNAQDYLAVWHEKESPSGAGQTRAARISGDGTLLDPLGFQIASGTGISISVASDGRDYMIVYDCDDNRYEPQSCIARVSASGEVERGARLANATAAEIAWNGDAYLVVYRTPNALGLSTQYIDGQPIGRDGSAIGKPFRIASTPFSRDLAIASNGVDFLVAWGYVNTLYGSIVGLDGVKGPYQQLNALFPDGRGVLSWNITSDGDGFLVIWEESVVEVPSNAYFFELQTARVSRDGAASRWRTLLRTPESGLAPDIVWTGSRYVIAYTGGGELDLYRSIYAPRKDSRIEFAPLDSNGELAAPPTPIADRAGPELQAALASNGDSTLVLCQHFHRSDGAQIEARIMPAVESSSPSIAIPKVISNAIAWQQSVGGGLIARTPLVVWQEFVDERQRRKVYLTRVDESGRSVDGRGVVIDESPDDQVRPAVGGSLVAWTEFAADGSATVYAKQLDVNGSPVGERIRIGDAARHYSSRIAIAGIGANHLVVWTDPRWRLVAIRVSGSGSLLDAAPIELSTTARRGAEYDPEIATDGVSYLVTWKMEEPWQCVFECIPPSSLHAALLSSTGVPVGSSIEIAPIYVFGSSVVWNGSAYAVFWSGGEYGPDHLDVSGLRARRIDRHGTLIDGKSLLVAEGNHDYRLSVAWTGTEYLLVNAYHRDGFFALRAGRIDGSLVLGESVVLSDGSSTSNVVIIRPDATILVAYARRTVANESYVSRIAMRVLGAPIPSRRRAVAQP